MARNYEKISISLHKNVLEIVDEMCRAENRGRSNTIETCLKDYFIIVRKKKPLARGIG